MDRGWTKSWRKRWDSDLATNPHANHLFQYLIDKAAYQETDTSFRYQCVQLQEGDVLVGLHSLSGRTGLTTRTIRTCLNYLKSTNRITIKPTNRFSIISIINWGIYQGDNTATDTQNDTQNDKQATKKRQASDNIEEVKELEKDQKQDRVTRKRFTPPTLEEVTEYCKSRGNIVNPIKWHSHYTANGWKVGKNKMVDWRAAVVTWEGS